MLHDNAKGCIDTVSEGDRARYMHTHCCIRVVAGGFMGAQGSHCERAPGTGDRYGCVRALELRSTQGKGTRDMPVACMRATDLHCPTRERVGKIGEPIVDRGTLTWSPKEFGSPHPKNKIVFPSCECLVLVHIDLPSALGLGTAPRPRPRPRNRFGLL